MHRKYCFLFIHHYLKCSLSQTILKFKHDIYLSAVNVRSLCLLSVKMGFSTNITSFLFMTMNATLMNSLHQSNQEQNQDICTHNLFYFMCLERQIQSFKNIHQSEEILRLFKKYLNNESIFENGLGVHGSPKLLITC